MLVTNDEVIIAIIFADDDIDENMFHQTFSGSSATRVEVDARENSKETLRGDKTWN